MTEWHSYAHGGQRGAISLLVFVSLALAYGWDRLQEHLALALPWWVDTPSVLGFYGIVYVLYDLKAWRWFRVLHGVPDLSGRYEVVLRTSHDGHTAEHPATLTIRQRWSKMVVRLETAQSTSVSNGGYLVEAPGEGCRLMYLYHNTPKPSAVGSMQQHDGTTELRFAEDGMTGRGSYYSGKGRSHHGELALTRREPDPEIASAQ
jgi:hypothetical protein